MTNFSLFSLLPPAPCSLRNKVGGAKDCRSSVIMIELKSSQSGLRLGFRVHWTHTCLRLGLHWTRSQTWTYLLERASVCLLVSIITTAVTCLFFANRRWFSAQVSKTNLLLLFVNPRCPTSECAKITVRQVPQEASAHILLQKKREILNKSKK